MLRKISPSALMLSLLLPIGLMAQTEFSITSFNTENLDGNLTLEVCPGNMHDLEFVVADGQLNAFGIADIIILDTLNPANPINNTVVGSFANGATGIVGTPGNPSAPIPVTVTIPANANTADYVFFVEAAPGVVNPAPAVSDTIQRSVIPNPISNPILDISSATYQNTFKTDSASRLLSFNPGAGPVAGGTEGIPPTALPVPDERDSTINFCEGDSLFLWNPDSLSATEHQWLRNGTLIALANLNQGHLWITESGYYTLVTERANTCKDSVAYIGVGTPGGATTVGTKGVYFNTYDVDTTITRTGPGNGAGIPTRFCKGDSVVLSAREISSHPQGSYAYQWVANGTDSISTNFEITVKDPGTYEVWITETIGTFTCQVKSNVIQVDMDSVPNLALNQTDTVGLLPGDSVLVTASVTNGVATNYEWFRIPNINPIATTADLKIFLPGLYYVRGTGPNGCSETDTLFVEDLSHTDLSITTFQSQDLDGNFTLAICPGNDYDIEWVVADGQVNPNTVVDIRIFDDNNPVNPLNNTVVGSYLNGGFPIVGVTGTPSAPVPVTITIPLSAPASNYGFYLSVVNGGTTPTPAESDTTFRNVINNPTSGMVLDTSTVTYDNTFKTDSTLILKSFEPGLGPVFGGVDIIPGFALPAPTPKDSTVNFCNGDSLYLWNPDSLTANGHTWMLNGAPIPANPNQGHIWVYQSGYYSLTTQSINTCEDSTLYIGVGQPGVGQSVGMSGIYFNAYEVDTTLSRVGVGNAVGRPTRFCRGDSLILSARENSSHPLGHYEYQWVANGTDSISTDFQIIIKEPGAYEVWITEVIDSSFSCQVLSNLVEVMVDSLPGSEIGTLGTTVCYGDTILVQDTNVYEPSHLYEWFANGQSLLGTFGDTNLIEMDTTLLASLGVTVDTMLYMTLVVTDTLGCDSTSSEVVFDFQAYPDIALSTADSIGLCIGDSILVSAFTTNGVSTVFTWYDLPANNVVSTNGNYWVTTDGLYWVEGVGPNGCTKYDTLTVTDLTIVANAGPDQTVDSGQVVQLGASGGVDYYWFANSPVYFNNPFDAAATTIPTADTTTYYVEVTGANGCSSIDSMMVFVRPPVPDPLEGRDNVQNVMTPNGDGINDVLDLSNIINGDNCELRIINRWGAFIRSFSNYQNNWDGTDGGGNLVPDGTYYYTLRCGNDEFRIKGAITILSGQSN